MCFISAVVPCLVYIYATHSTMILLEESFIITQSIDSECRYTGKQNVLVMQQGACIYVAWFGSICYLREVSVLHFF